MKELTQEQLKQAYFRRVERKVIKQIINAANKKAKKGKKKK